jgi:hypothetical protein
MGPLDRTRDGALQTLMQLLDQGAEQLVESTRSILTESLVGEVFETAWDHQFEEDRRPSQRQVRELVQSAVLEAQLGEEE